MEINKVNLQNGEFDEISVRRKIERDKGSKYYINDKEVRARDVQTFFADLSTGAHSPSLISQGRIGQLVTSKPIERKSILEEAAGISGIHARRQEAETRLNAAENNLKRADELKKQQQKQLDNLKKQAEEATRYKEISKERVKPAWVCASMLCGPNKESNSMPRSECRKTESAFRGCLFECEFMAGLPFLESISFRPGLSLWFNPVYSSAIFSALTNINIDKSN